MRRQLELTLELTLLLVPVLPSAGARSSSKFDVVWSGLWPCCDGRTGFNLSQFPVLQLGRLALFDSTLGLYNETIAPVGLPQTVDLASHAAKVAADVAATVPADKDMYCCIDWEQYTPVIFDHATATKPQGGPGSGGCPGTFTAPNGDSRYSMPGASCAMANAALNASVDLVRKSGGHALNDSAVAAEAVAAFNAAAKMVWLKTLEVAKITRPQCKWGYYGKPETEDITPPFVDAFDRAVGDAYQWMFDEQTALFPSTYMHYTQDGSPPPLNASYNTHFVEAITREALRVNGNRPTGLPSAPVLPWVWYRYISDHTKLLLPADMHTALAGPGAVGAHGVLVYEDGIAQVGEPLHLKTQAYIDTVLGPTATSLYGKSPRGDGHRSGAE